MKKTNQTTRHPLWHRWRYICDCQSDYDTRDSRNAKQLGLGCDWTNFRSFREDIEAKLGLPKANQQLVRIDTTRGWHLDNLHYCSTLDKAQLQRGLTYYRYKGKNYTLKNLARHLKMNYHTLYTRMLSGWPLKAAIALPVRKKNARKKKV